MIEKTEALVLRIVPYSKTSQVITWLSPDHGRLVTLAKGACRPKSSFLGQYDLFYTCELLFYRNDRNAAHIHILRECSPTQSRDTFRQNWRAMMCASYVCDLAWRVSQENHGQPDLYELTSSSLNYLCTGNIRPQFPVWFELKLMDILGMSPQIARCQTCRKEISSTAFQHVSFLPSQGIILCPACSGRNAEPSIPVTPDILAMLRNWQASGTATLPGNTKITEKQLIALRKILGTFLEYHLDFVPLSRSVVMDTIQEKPVARHNNKQKTGDSS